VMQPPASASRQRTWLTRQRRRAGVKLSCCGECPKTPALAQPVTELKAAAVVAAETLGRNDMRPPTLSDRSRAA